MGEYAGRIQSPLRYESAFSHLARAVALNEISGSAFLRLLGIEDRDRKWDVLNKTFLPIDGIHWRLYGPNTPRETRKILDGHFCSASLRVCDECIGSMYHSLWHQCWIVNECPLHNCRLRTVCLFCNQSYGDYTFTQAVNNRFFCRHCLNSLSAEPATIARHLGLRAIASRLETVLAGVLRQLLIVAVMSRRLSHLETSFPFSEVNRWWPDRRSYWDVMRDVGCAYPKQARMSPAMTWLVWPSSHHHVFRDYAEVDLAYCETIDSLRHWLIQRYPGLVDAGERPALFDESGVPRTDLWPPEILAFMLLRQHVEENARSWGLQPAAEGIPRTSKYDIVCRTWFARSRLRWEGFARDEFFQAMVYGRFAALYWAAKTGVLAGKRFQGDDYVVPCFWGDRTWEPDIAAVVFPSIDGMPLGRFNPSPLRFKDAVDVLYRDGLSRQRDSLAMRRAKVGQHFPYIINHRT